MSKDEFAARVTALEGTMYRVSYSMLKNPHDQADAIQESIARAWKKLASLREEAYFQTWILRILLNVCRDFIKKRKQECPLDEVEAVAPAISDGVMMEALAALDEKYRMTIVLHHVEGYTTREVSRMMRVPEGTVKFRLTRGRALLRELLAQGGDEHEYAR